MTFSSVYEMFDPLTTVRKQRFWDWMSGDALRSIWTERDVVGTNTFAMNDAVDGGYAMTTAGGAGDKMTLDFNNKRQYSYTGAVIIMVVKANSATAANFIHLNGLFSNQGGTLNSSTDFRLGNSESNIRFVTTNAGAGETNSDTGIALDTNWHVYKIENKASSVEGTVDGTLTNTNTTNLSSANEQPEFYNWGLAASAQTQYIRYCEAYNT